MKAKDKSILQQIQERYPGTDPDIDIDWEVGEIFFNEGEKQGIDKGRKEVVEWAEGDCPHLLPRYNRKPRKDCPLCWQAFKKKLGL